jgi:Glycosyltransferase family 87
VIEGLPSFVNGVRGRVAGVAGLRWARFDAVDAAVPVGMVVVAFGLRGELGVPIGGVPFWLAWIVATAVCVAALRVRSIFRAPARPRPGAIPGAIPGSTPGLAFVTLVVWVVAGWVLFDILLWQQSNHLYDFDVYLASAGRWLAGGQPYMTAPATSWPATAAQDFFLYPPPLLPFFGLLSKLPDAPVAVAWVGFLAASAYASFRALGLRPTWSLLLLAFPPVMIGFESGNVASVTFLLFALAYRAGGSLALDGLFKVQAAIPALWLVRTRRWRGLVTGLAALTAIALVTLPLVGLDSWRAWLAGLGYRAESQAVVISMFGYSEARFLPGAAFAALSVMVVAVALLFSGRRGLAALGLASIVASPSLWPHGFVFALPAVLMLESGTGVWIVLGAGAVGPSMWLLLYGGWIAVIATRRLPDARHPMAGTDGPWPRPNLTPAPRRSAAPRHARRDAPQSDTQTKPT